MLQPVISFKLTSTYNFKWVKISHICLIWDHNIEDAHVETHFILNNSDLICSKMY